MSGAPGFEAGWFPDPSEPGAERYWDGVSWTDARRPVPMTEPAPFLASLGDAPLRRMPSRDGAALPPQSPGQPAAAYVNDSNPFLWLIASSPLWLLLGAYALNWAFAPLPEGRAPLWTTFVVLGAIALIVFAELDRRVLVARGASKMALPLWMLLTPVAYLLARRAALREVPGLRMAPLTVFVVLLVVVVAAIVFAAFLGVGAFFAGVLIGTSL